MLHWYQRIVPILLSKTLFFFLVWRTVDEAGAVQSPGKNADPWRRKMIFRLVRAFSTPTEELGGQTKARSTKRGIYCPPSLLFWHFCYIVEKWPFRPSLTIDPSVGGFGPTVPPNNLSGGQGEGWAFLFGFSLQVGPRWVSPTRP